MRVLLITQHYPPQMGGIQNNLVSVARCFAPEDLTIVAPVEETRENTQPTNHLVIRLPFRKQIGYLLAIPKLFWLIRRKGIEMIYCGHIKQALEAYVLKKLTRTPYVIAIYARELHQFKKSWLKRSLLQFVLKRAAGLITISEYSKEQIYAFAGGESDLPPIHIVHPIGEAAVPISDTALIRMRARHHLQDKRVIFSVSRLEERKGVDMVLKALPRIWKKVPEAAYIIASSGPYEKNLQELAQSSIAQYPFVPETEKEAEKIAGLIQFIGRISDEEKAIWLCACDVFVTPSRVIQDEDAEGFGIVFLEANAYGKPVVGGRSGGVPDAVIDGETGLLVNPESVEEVAEAIIRLLTDEPYAKELGQNGKRRVEGEFTQERFCERVEEVLRIATTGAMSKGKMQKSKLQVKS